jgi:hypothetical protein
VDLDLWVKAQLFFQAFLIQFSMFLSKNGISRSTKHFRQVDLDLKDQNKTFFFQVFFDKNFDVLSINSILGSAKQFCKVNLDLWVQNETFSSKHFLTKKAFYKVLNDFAKWI